MIKKIALFFIVLVIVISCSGYRKPYKYVIDAEKDAFYHNNLGINYLQDRIYFAAIQEFKIAIQLSPSTQASAIFYNNLGETYNFIGYPEMAQTCFEDALKLYGLNFKYYMNLTDCYINRGIAKVKIEQFKKSNDLFDRIKLGLLYIKTGEVRRGVNILDEITMEEPDILITPAIRQYLKFVTENML